MLIPIGLASGAIGPVLNDSYLLDGFNLLLTCRLANVIILEQVVATQVERFLGQRKSVDESSNSVIKFSIQRSIN